MTQQMLGSLGNIFSSHPFGSEVSSTCTAYRSTVRRVLMKSIRYFLQHAVGLYNGYHVFSVPPVGAFT